jgi:pyruvate formate lyase activating enzyme
MVFGGIQKNSLIDYPGKNSCVLFFAGCNFSCPYCHNPNLIKGERLRSCLVDDESAFKFIKERKGFLDGVVLSGGEPTIQKNLFSLCKKIKQIGYPIKLDTNGSRPQVIRRLIKENLVDYIAMDIKTEFSHYFPLIKKSHNPDNILTSIEHIMVSDTDYEFRTTCVKPFVDANIIKNIAKIIEGASLYVLQPFNNTNVLDPKFFNTVAPGYEMNELLYLKSIAKPWVKRCIVR